MVTPVPLDPAELLAHAGWMRALAASLVRDSAAADDVVQESLAAALRRGPERNRPVEAWLARVVRNVASNFRRAEAREAERRPRGASPQPPDPAETIERLDTQRRIVELVRALDEPSRSTIVLRYFEGLTSEQIGARMGVSDATVRWRLSKALEELRARLQKGYGSREAWCAVLAPLADPQWITAAAGTGAVSAAGVAAGGAAAGAIAMGTASKVAAAAVLATAVGAGWWMTRESSSPEVRSAETAEAVDAEAKAVELPIAVAPVEREVIERAQPTSPEPSAPASAATLPPAATEKSPPAHVRARFVDTAGQPWGGVLFRESVLGGKSTTSGPDGRAELELEAAGAAKEQTLQFLATREGCAMRTMRATLAGGRTVDLGEVVLDRECRLRGTARDEAGKGIGGVTVGLAVVELEETDAGKLRRHGSLHFDRALVSETNARGEFDLRGVPAGNWRLWGHVEGRGYGVGEPFEVHAGDELLGQDLQVPALLATDLIRGVVVDPTGAPVPRADLTVSYEVENESGTSGLQANKDGTFEALLYKEAVSDIVATDKEKRWGDGAVRGILPGARDVVIQLTDLASQPLARLRVRGPDEEPVREVKVESRTGNESTYSTNDLVPKETEPGLYEMQLPLLAYAITVEAPGYIDSAPILLDPSNLPPELEVELELAPVVKGRVVAGAKPVAGARVEAKREVDRGHSMTFNGFPCVMTPHEQTSAKSGADGAFTLLLESRQPVYLRVTAPGFAPTIVGPLRVDGAPQTVEIELAEGGVLEGRARAKDGSPVVGAIVGITCGDGHPRTMRSGHDGVFRFEGLSAGQWMVLERDAEFRTDYTTTSSTDSPSDIKWSCEVTAGRTTYHDLTLEK